MDCLYVFLFDLFFFFKQKTAYEMRISDWSSDVCSSDLTTTASRITMALRTVRITSITSGVNQLIALPPADRRRFCRISPVEYPPGRPAEIGRASGRERVCQYV